MKVLFYLNANQGSTEIEVVLYDKCDITLPYHLQGLAKQLTDGLKVPSNPCQGSPAGRTSRRRTFLDQVRSADVTTTSTAGLDTRT